MIQNPYLYGTEDNFNLKREIRQTADGSPTIYLPSCGESYHSKHGAIQEAFHVFIHNGLHCLKKQQINLLEIGFGTALNVLITAIEAEKNDVHISYEAVEAFPLTIDEVQQLNYAQLLGVSESNFQRFHTTPWEIEVVLSPHFSLKKRQQQFEEITDSERFDLIYYDAFGARVQPELWTATMFRKMYNALSPGGILVTYASKSSARRAMLEVGFTVEKLPGPVGRREMLRATKLTIQ